MAGVVEARHNHLKALVMHIYPVNQRVYRAVGYRQTESRTKKLIFDQLIKFYFWSSIYLKLGLR